MHADQRKARQVMVETDFVTPTGFTMTAFTLFTFLSGMHIIGTMTGITFCAEVLLLRFATMTGCTAYIAVLAQQRKIGFLVMPENRLAPFPGRVAGITLPAILPAVFIIAAVAGDTLRFQLFFQFALVAGIAYHLAVFSG